jgi:hypothetical protein
MQLAHEGKHVVLSADAARQGVTGHNVRYVLAWGLLGVVTSYLVIGILATQGVFGSVGP